MQNLLAVVVVLTCLGVQIAQPLATSYDDEARRGLELLENENLVQQHHVRHRTAHLRTAHHSRHRQHADVRDAAKSESAAAAAVESTTPALPDDATESMYLQRGAHKQQQHKLRLQIDLDNRLQQEQQQKHNALHTHAHHRNAQKSRTTTTTSTTEATDNDTEAVVDASEKELVKPTWPPTKHNEHTINADEANKGTQNYYHQPIIRQQQQLQQPQQHQQHHKHHKLQPAADLSRTSATPMTSVPHIIQAPAAAAPAVDLPVKTHNNKLVHASSQINVDTDSNTTSAALLHAHHSTVGGLKERIALAETHGAGLRLTTENTSNDKDKTRDYEDDDLEYYDYNADDDEANESNAEQQPLAVPDIGYGYGYDSGIDGGIEDVEWRPAHVTSDYLRTAHHQQLRHNQEQWQAQMQLQRRQHWYRQEQQQQQQQQQQQYEIEHSRVARDHHRVQSEELHNNHLAYDTSADDEYADDEPDRGSREREDISKTKFETLGTPEAVQKEHNAYVQSQKSPTQLAIEHYNHMKVATRCRRPIPRVIHVSNYTFKTYHPSYTILYRCGEDTGCCRSMGQTCTVKKYENVPLYFMVELVNSSNSRKHPEVLMLRNDTECHCINRTYLTSTPEFITRDKRSDLAYRRRTRSHIAAFDGTMDAANQLEERSDLEYDSEKSREAVCRCPRHFDVFQEDIRWEATQRRHESQTNVARTYNCRCDCADANASCQRFKNGDEGFAMDDRRCIAERLCSVPNCSFGIYNEQIGRCPRSNRKLKRHNNGFG
ncbi:uncharacterized protein LOC126767264 [Bactrocera neohumeralis]|uniref:uncharacterized protein LOC126767264 n=1 Tax=Bactrocera neohumeralis TaxID=98809 RepID=UPI002165991B|nr:uncharacterized protein LOC126767264 [Bactrocera neohumeralis]XP_050340784.1 uncharacterized protein LOC126767264 [Bactrocera neohumeralis]XP_050340785.1 uncharacterized protein LOC126767264 [Bactrocera neohumeralis]XP_050340786.1 uncharacterized protein LOC126767264 [Bactrocera neohumeralis]